MGALGRAVRTMARPSSIPEAAFALTQVADVHMVGLIVAVRPSLVCGEIQREVEARRVTLVDPVVG